MGKKGKGNKLAKMSEEERARYLQLRADIEEEARRRKMHLITLFMKNKLKREDAFCRLNLAKINQEWRSLLRYVKCDELRKEMVELEKFCKEAIERKDHTINRLLNDLDEAEDTYATLQQSHMETIRKMLESHAQRTEFFTQAYESEKHATLEECDEDIKNFNEMSGQAQEQLECVKYQLESLAEKQFRENQERHLERVDDLKSGMTLELEEITKSREAILENLWQEFQNVLNGYVQRTEGFYSEYMDLKDRDDENTAIMRENCLEIERLSDQLAHLKLIDADATEKWDFKVNQLTKLRNELTEQLADRKKQVEQEIHDDEQRIKFVSVDSYEILKKLKKIEKRGETLLQLALVCQKYETDREKMQTLGFANIHAKRNLFEHNEQTLREPPDELKENTLGTWQQMENFWKRVNNITIDVVCLKQEKVALQNRNFHLKQQLQDHLANINIANGSNAHINDYLAKRPSSMHVNRVQQIDLEPKPTKGKSFSAGVFRKMRPSTTCVEANFTNAVRSKRLAEGKPKLPRIVTIINW